MPKTLLTPLYANDEDCFIEGGPDFGIIPSSSMVMAAGTDGAFSSGDLWTLTSASSNFVSQGVEAGMVLQITEPKNVYLRPQFLAIDSVSSGGLTLRRIGLAATGTGLPPGIIGGNSGITFQILTMKPQIESAVRYLNNHFAINATTPYRTPSDIQSQDVFRRLVVLRVFFLLYTAENRTDAGEFLRKYNIYKEMFDSELSTTTVRWGALGSQQPETFGAFMRISR